MTSPPEAPRGPLHDASEAFALLDAWDRQGRDQVARANAIQSRLQALRVSVWSPGHEVAVTVDHTGLVVDLEFTDRALDRGPAALGETITRTARSALEQLAVQAEEQVVDAVGEGDALGRSAIAHYRSSLLGAAEDQGR
ncbi:YbaB/EbfC family nucleoid-associated protein [Cellulomonas soli]|uniref:YbaB/EbfC DNA-binding family protein n=1 Tax=Cellulomonas soli TaxID=931535 RepID=A0A512PED6_9CELL|nr:YbaB/EbfC family nucleoid-associated protein [Cellulomonas soli]NYI58961.1 DNA-binding protein YbaB [Cellulomonas soli]GEP69546.1 hypothetical protein CSO01_22610 [Cellulomonas soli]